MTATWKTYKRRKRFFSSNISARIFKAYTFIVYICNAFCANKVAFRAADYQITRKNGMELTPPFLKWSKTLCTLSRVNGIWRWGPLYARCTNVFSMSLVIKDDSSVASLSNVVSPFTRTSLNCDTWLSKSRNHKNNTLSCLSKKPVHGLVRCLSQTVRACI